MGYEKSARVYDIFDDKDNFELFVHYGLKAGEILDIGAGTGRIAIALARKGITVFAVEPSPAMRAEFTKKLTARPDLSPRIHLIASDAASFAFSRTFPAAFMSGAFDHLLNDGQRRAALYNISRHLKPGGTFVFDLFVGLMDSSEFKLAGDIHDGSLQYKRYVGREVKDENVVEVQLLYELYDNDRLTDTFEERSLVGVTSRSQIRALLHRCGFEVVEEFSDYNFRPYREGDDLLIIEARKSDHDPAERRLHR